MIANVSLPPSSTLFPPHVENVAQVMGATWTPIAHQRTRWLVWCAYIDDEAEEGSEEDGEDE